MIPAVETVIKTKLYGEWLLMVFADDENCFSSTHRVLIKNRESLNDIVCVRVHSDCYLRHTQYPPMTLRRTRDAVSAEYKLGRLQSVWNRLYHFFRGYFTETHENHVTT